MSWPVLRLSYRARTSKNHRAAVLEDKATVEPEGKRFPQGAQWEWRRKIPSIPARPPARRETNSRHTESLRLRIHANRPTPYDFADAETAILRDRRIYGGRGPAASASSSAIVSADCAAALQR